MSLIDLVDKLITERGSATVMRERLLLVKEQVEMLQEKVKTLEEENTHLKKENSYLKNQLIEKANTEQFVEYRGALFKKKRGGGYILAVYCPVCKISVASIEKSLPFYCQRCKWAADFTGKELPAIIAEIDKS